MSDTSFHALDKETITKAYARWAPVYDLVFGAVFERGREAAIAAAERIGGRILEVGVGTGISLPDYAPANKICGVDISEPMLQKAMERVAKLNLDHVEGLWVMDAEHLRFPEPTQWVPQYVVERVLKQRLVQLPSVQIAQGVALEEASQSADGITATVRNTETAVPARLEGRDLRLCGRHAVVLEK